METASNCGTRRVAISTLENGAISPPGRHASGDMHHKPRLIYQGLEGNCLNDFENSDYGSGRKMIAIE